MINDINLLDRQNYNLKCFSLNDEYYSPVKISIGDIYYFVVVSESHIVYEDKERIQKKEILSVSKRFISGFGKEYISNGGLLVHFKDFNNNHISSIYTTSKPFCNIDTTFNEWQEKELASLRLNFPDEKFGLLDLSLHFDTFIFTTQDKADAFIEEHDKATELACRNVIYKSV